MKQRNTDIEFSLSSADLLAMRSLAKDIKLHPIRRSLSSMDGNFRSHMRGRGMEFAEVRPYNPGDDVRSIDWRVTARSQTPYTKLYQEEKERPVCVVLDQRSPMFFGSTEAIKSVIALRLATVIAWAAIDAGDRLSSLIFNDHTQEQTRSKRGKLGILSFIHHAHEMNQALEAALLSNNSASKKQSIDQILDELCRTIRPGSSIYFISDFHDFSESARDRLYRLAKHNEIHFIFCYDPLEAQLPSGKHLLATDGIHKSAFQTDRAFTEQYQSGFTRAEESLKDSCYGAGIRYSNLSTCESLKDFVFSQFHFKASKKSR